MKRLAGATIAAVFSLLLPQSLPASDSPAHASERQFLDWFRSHEKLLYEFERDQDNVFAQLTSALKKVDHDLTFEFGPKLPNGRREFVISAGGIRATFPKVESLFAAAPKLDHWIFIKFRPRRQAMDLEFHGKRIKSAEVKFLLLEDADQRRVGILLLIPGYREDEREDFEAMAFLVLDNVLGEYDVETKVGAVLVKGTDSPQARRSHPLLELTAKFDEQMKERAK